MIERRLSVGLVVERIAPSSPWASDHWRPWAVLPMAPATEPWTVLSAGADRTVYYAGEAIVHLYSTDTANYRDNLASGSPKLWVVMRAPEAGGEARPGVDVVVVTADPAEGEGNAEAAGNLVETVAMPPEVAGEIAEFIAEHHVERPVIKRRRDRSDFDVRWRDGRDREPADG